MTEVQKHTPGPWFVGAQNDMLYITAGRPPSPSNDHPWHDAPRVCLAKVFDRSDDDVLPVLQDGNARLIAAAPELLEALQELLAHASFIGIASHYENMARAAIAKAEGK